MPNPSRTSQVADLANQWEQLIGFAVPIGPDVVNAMADAGVMSLYDIGQWMDTHGQEQLLGGVDYGTYPWARWGMSASEYHTKVLSLVDTFAQLTGNNQPPSNFLEAALKQHQGQMTSAEFQDWLMLQPGFQDTYGWLKYGMNYQAFQQQKLQMQTNFGQPLTDQDAMRQLQYFHAAQGSDQQVSVQPTLTQQEKRAVNVGVAQSEVR